MRLVVCTSTTCLFMTSDIQTGVVVVRDDAANKRDGRERMKRVKRELRRLMNVVVVGGGGMNMNGNVKLPRVFLPSQIFDATDVQGDVVHHSCVFIHSS